MRRFVMFGLKLLEIFKEQLLGTGNMFRYKTRSVNHLYLFYCIFGKIFHIRGFHWLFKLLFWILHFSVTICGYITGFFYLQYGDKTDFTILLYIAFVLSICTLITIIVPLASHWYAHDIETMLDLMDRVLMKRDSSSHCLEDDINMKKILTNDLLVILTCGIIFSSTCVLDVLVFYEDYKVKNSLFYVMPFSNVEQYGSRTLLLISTGLIHFGTILPVIEVWTVLKFFETWAAACHQKVMSISEQMRIHSNNLIIKTASIPDHYNDEKVIAEKVILSENLRQNFIPLIKIFQEVTRLVEIPKKYYQVISALIIIASFSSQLAHAYIFLATDLAPAVRCKEVALFAFTAVLTFIICRVGEVFDDLTSLMSLEIYSTPWYILLPSFRKDILMILCQTQNKVQLKAMGVYSINVNMFLRLLNSIFSTTNILAKLMRKHSSTN